MSYDKELEEKTGIFVFDNLIPDDACDELVDFHKRSTNKKQGELARGHVNTEIKNSVDVVIQDPDMIRHLEPVHKTISDIILEKYPILTTIPMSASYPQIQRYNKEEGYFKEHIDSNVNDPLRRNLALICYLNDVEEGGETVFKNLHGVGDIEVKAKKGRVVVFPTTWKYVHEGNVPVSEDKYMISQFVIEDDGTNQ